ncbi:helix-turn-helix domain-containing protein [Salinarimonas chemoclinalis]|uniref:helix-turn-helix domain-containing protein n=1 Tax=Salinarimonas chemoclinalis TaxID=3241599 RepID=UPI0035576D62
MVQKSTHTAEYAAMLRLLVERRKSLRLHQADVAATLPFKQPEISKIERGERRIDVVELRMICTALHMSLPEFVAKLEERIAALHATESAADARAAEPSAKAR